MTDRKMKTPAEVAAEDERRAVQVLTEEESRRVARFRQSFPPAWTKGRSPGK